MQSIGEAFREKGKDGENNFLLLRLGAAILVLYGHCNALAKHAPGYRDFFSIIGFQYAGDIGLYIFFVVSGFLVVASFDRSEDLLKFARARILRIFPALFVFLSISAFVVGPYLSSLPLSEYFASSEVYAFVRGNGLLIEYMPKLPGVFEGEKLGSLIGTLWSLFVEFRLYLIVALFGCFGLFRVKHATAFGVSLFALIAVISPWRTPVIAGNETSLIVSSFFAVGALVYIYRDSIPLNVNCFVVLVLLAFFSKGTLSYFYLCCASLTYFVFLFAFSPKIKIPQFFGDYSYGVYLYGWPIQKLINYWLPSFGPYKMMIVAVPFSILAGAISWHYVEKRCLAWKDARIFRTSAV
jgi:peptidoglycan/LPS O-acetylase OafA/YrhL